MMEWLGFNGAAAVDGFWDKLSGSNVVPWSSWHEWDVVRDSLFSSSPASALNRIRAWRGKGCLPSVVDITSSLIEIQQKDPFFNAKRAGGQLGDELLSQEMMSMLYCMAIIRLVNCVIERTRKRNGKSIAEAAEEIQIPRMLIDIRHEGSHRDLPSLEILRLASVEALEWLKMYYWNPQKEAVSCEDENRDVKKQIKAKINELAYMLTMKNTPKKSSPIVDKKRENNGYVAMFYSDYLNLLLLFVSLCWLSPTNFFLKLVTGPKKQISKALKNLLRLYLSFPYGVVDMLLNYMVKHYSSSLSDLDIDVQSTPSEKNMQSVFDDWEPVIVKVSEKDPNFIFTFLEAVLNETQRQYSEENNIGDHSMSSLETVKDSLRVCSLSALFAWLVGNLRNMKPSSDKSSADTCNDTSEMLTPRYRIMKLMRTCLHVATPENEQLTQSVLVLAQLTANGSLSEKLKKLLKASLLGTTCPIDTMSEYTIEQQENHLRQAAKQFEQVKCSKLKIQPFHAARNADFGSDSKWGVAESWNQCVVGMLPNGFGSLDLASIPDNEKVDKLSELKESSESNPCNCKRKLSDEDAILLKGPDAKKLRETVEDPDSDNQVTELDGFVHGAGGVKGHLLLNGVWRRIGEDEINAVGSSVRIMAW
ncbi:unnamed protein product [Rhodiola kirilowii]